MLPQRLVADRAGRPAPEASCLAALHGRQLPVLIEAGFDELQAGDLAGAPIQAYRSWKHLHAPDSRFPHGESPADALRRHANALRRLLARTETVTLVVIHEFALRHIAMAAAAGGSRLPDMVVGNAVPYLFDERAAQRPAASHANRRVAQPQLVGSRILPIGALDGIRGGGGAEPASGQAGSTLGVNAAGSISGESSSSTSGATTTSSASWRGMCFKQAVA